MTTYELISFVLRVRTSKLALARLEHTLEQALPGVQLLGCWISEIGPQNQIAILRGFADEKLKRAERERWLMAPDAFGLAEFLLDQRVDDYQLFPFLEPLEPGAHGPFYELREYNLVPSGLVPTLDGWASTIGERTGKGYSPVYAAFYAVSGRVPRYLHIWPYSSLEERLDVRGRSVQDGVWPPVNSAPQLREMTSTIYQPAHFSPLN